VTDVVGTVAQLSVYPVKSLAGRTVDAAEIGPAGLAGDRAWVVVDPASGERVTVKGWPAMAGVVATGDGAADTATLTAVLGRPVRLARAGSPQPGAAAVHLVSRAAVARAAAGVVPEGCSADDPRANVLLDLPDGADERSWVGRTVRLGEVELRVTRTPKHCLGVYADVLRTGTVRAGDPVELAGP
jgi:uncharacterized protein YcbX